MRGLWKFAAGLRAWRNQPQNHNQDTGPYGYAYDNTAKVLPPPPKRRSSVLAPPVPLPPGAPATTDVQKTITTLGKALTQKEEEKQGALSQKEKEVERAQRQARENGRTLLQVRKDLGDKQPPDGDATTPHGWEKNGNGNRNSRAGAQPQPPGRRATA